MKNLWNNQDAAQFVGDLAQCVYSSRLLGNGSTSVKLHERDVFDDEHEILHVTASGSDLAPCRRDYLLRLAQLDKLPDGAPSAETILHAVLPHKFVAHSHPDALLAVMIAPDGAARLAEIYGNRVAVVPQLVPVRSCTPLAGEPAIGLALMNHGLLTFGDTAKQAYDRMIELVTLAEEYLARHNAWNISLPAVTMPTRPLRVEIARRRRDASAAAGAPVILRPLPDLQFPDLAAAQRALFDPELGLCAFGRTAKDAVVTADLCRRSVEIALRASKLAGHALPPQHIFDTECEPSQTSLPFTGEIAVVTGAASGIGKACVDSMLARGAAVIGLDINPAITTLYERPDFAGIVCDLTDETQIVNAMEQAVKTFGGVDMLVLNAGIFPKACQIADMPLAHWRKVFAINLDANLILMRECHPLLKLAPNHGRIAIIGSKNVLAPGPGAAAYSASKAAVNQLARVAALEWGPDKIRINSLHPNGVFDTALWPDEVLTSRAKSYGLTVEEYKMKNVMKVEVKSHDVAELAAEMCGPLFAKTTASQIPVDGGNDRVI